MSCSYSTRKVYQKHEPSLRAMYHIAAGVGVVGVGLGLAFLYDAGKSAGRNEVLSTMEQSGACTTSKLKEIREEIRKATTPRRRGFLAPK